MTTTAGALFDLILGVGLASAFQIFDHESERMIRHVIKLTYTEQLV